MQTHTCPEEESLSSHWSLPIVVKVKLKKKKSLTDFPLNSPVTKTGSYTSILAAREPRKVCLILAALSRKAGSAYRKEEASLFFILFSNFKLFILYWGIADYVVAVSGEQQRDSTKHIYVSILSQTPLPSRLAHNIVQSSM